MNERTDEWMEQRAGSGTSKGAIKDGGGTLGRIMSGWKAFRRCLVAAAQRTSPFSGRITGWRHLLGLHMDVAASADRAQNSTNSLAPVGIGMWE